MVQTNLKVIDSYIKYVGYTYSPRTAQTNYDILKAGAVTTL